MNEKKAKFLRRAARIMGCDPKDRQYTTAAGRTGRTVLVPTGRLNLDGLPENVPFKVVDPTVLAPECGRSWYQQAKRRLQYGRC